jgi:hypothetical protein
MSGENDGVLMWCVDTAFAVHPSMRGHTGGGLTMGCGFPIAVSTKQKMNTKSLTESELVRVNNMMPIILWTCNFLLEQGYGVIENLLLQDNRSSILLERNGSASSSKRTRHMNICYFFISDQVNMKKFTIDWCSMKQMAADFMTKPLQERQYRNLRDNIMGRVRSTKPNNDVVKVVKQDGRTTYKKLIKKTSKVTGRGSVKLVAQ